MELSPGERERLEDLRQMMGAQAGSLAFALDRLTDVMALVGQHKVYCRIEKGLRAGEPALDVVAILDGLRTAKTLLQETMQQLRQDKG
jgi:hypothetical protein